MTTPIPKPSPTPHPLDNVIWNALNTRQVEFAQGARMARRFVPEVGPLAGVPELSEAAFAALAELANGGAVALFSPEPLAERKGWKIIGGGPLVQMVWDEAHASPAAADKESPLVALGAKDSNEMQALAQLTKPGPFGPRTHELGNYFGVRDQGHLAAMAGERLRVAGYTEVSAVCTHPDCLGRGYASMVMRRVMQGIRARGETPFLHSRADNDRAISVYERLGFRARQQGYFTVLEKE